MQRLFLLLFPFWMGRKQFFENFYTCLIYFSKIGTSSSLFFLTIERQDTQTQDAMNVHVCIEAHKGEGF